ncbi:RrF2 family transcriptional regulator [Acetivibrio ethanolgignens]|uniref:Rrf2 family transcriptional regulator n=1 Tax=Acetivibrio ethanolgignens TaxID=290052 RepID=A0A0V8QJC3_9FIRM|nr:Rrf2 family transcriptional regulator [Acetivibrio ethanolgignens]KSV60631.1 Rrf2 family transcriptional regulator [Acetivibrio ethanolgignens]
MLFTRECDYAIRVMRTLSTGECMSVSMISEIERLPYAMTYKITRKLERAGLLKSYRGSKGGYALKRNSAEITLYDICVVIMPDILVFECMKEGHSCPKNTEKKPCKIHCEMARLQKILIEELKRKSLEEILW